MASNVPSTTNTPHEVETNNFGGVNNVVLSIVLPILAVIALILRFLARRERKTKFWLDDWLMLVTLLLFFVHSSLNILSTVLIGAWPQNKNPNSVDRVAYLKVLLVTSATYSLSLGIAKVSVCLLYVRIFSVVRPLKIAAYTTTALIACWIFITIVVSLTICQPLSTKWDPTPHGHCGSETNTTLAGGITDIFFDFLVLVIPIPQVWRLKISNLSKVALTAVFALGFVDFAAGILRITRATKSLYSGDWNSDIAMFHFWSTLRPGLAIIIGCALVMRPLLEKWMPRFLTLFKSSQGSSKHGYSLPRVTKQQVSEDDVSRLLHSGGTRSVAMTRSQQLKNTSLALPGQMPRKPHPTATRHGSNDVINVHRFVQVEEEQIETPPQSQVPTPSRSRRGSIHLTSTLR